MQRGSPEEKTPAQAVSEKKKFVQAENSLPPPPNHFSNGPSLSCKVGGAGRKSSTKQSFNRPEKNANKLKKRYVNQNETLAHDTSVLP